MQSRSVFSTDSPSTSKTNDSFCGSGKRKSSLMSSFVEVEPSSSFEGLSDRNPAYEIDGVEMLSHDDSTTDSHSAPKKRCQMNISTFLDNVSASENEELSLLWAESCYTNRFAFNCMNSPFLNKFFKKIRPGWKPPSPYQLANKLLETTSAKVDGINTETLLRSSNVTLMLMVGRT